MFKCEGDTATTEAVDLVIAVAFLLMFWPFTLFALLVNGDLREKIFSVRKWRGYLRREMGV